MLRSMYSGVSGLRNHQVRLDVIGNNIANVNTIGFKSSRVTFKDVLSQTLKSATRSQAGRGGSNPVQVGLGMTIASIDTNHTQGSMQSTGKTTDLAIEGTGFFVLRSGTRNVFTRAGNFDLDENGFLVVPGTGLKVQGWVDGKMQDIQISNSIVYPASETKNLIFGNNLDSETVAGATFTTTVDVFDSLGALHTVELSFTKGVGNVWDWEMSYPNPVSGEARPSGTLNFDGSGKLIDNQKYSISFTPVVTDIVPWSALQPSDFSTTPPTWENTVQKKLYEYNDPYTGDKIEVEVDFQRNGDGIYTWSFGGTSYAGTYDANTNTHTGHIPYFRQGDAKKPLEIALDFRNVTSTAEETTVAAAGRDGAPMGSLKSYSIDNYGNIVGEFSNGLLKNIGQIALAKFANPAGLSKAGDTSFVESNNSGMPQFGRAGGAGFGDIAPGSLEMSNVDLSQEFTEMIVTQRGLQANSRIITTSDEVLQEVVNLKR